MNRVSVIGSVSYFCLSGGLVGLGVVAGRLVMTWLIAIWFIFVITMLILYHEFRCPRCKKRFFADRFDFQQMTRECVHCGLPKYGNANPAIAPDPRSTRTGN